MKLNRRSFITKGAAGAALFSIMPREVLGKMGGDNNYIAPSDQLTRGLIGVGGIGRSGSHFVSDQKCRLVALCDVDQKHLDSALTAAKQKWGEDLKSYHDFRDLTDKATFFYSLDGKQWQPIGDTLQMHYDMPDFCGQRFMLFNFATKTAGGVVDFDFFHVSASPVR